MTYVSSQKVDVLEKILRGAISQRLKKGNNSEVRVA